MTFTALDRQGAALIYGPPASTLTAGKSLGAGQQLISPNGRYMLAMQYDGNLVLYNVNTGVNTGVLWSSGTGGHPGAYVTMQVDGNFVVYRSSGQPLWASNTVGTNANSATLQDDGNFVLYTAAGVPKWSTQYGRVN
jgi:hypothetical protein